MLVIEGLDICLAGFVLMRLSAMTLQFHLALEDVDVGRHRMFMQWRAAARLDDSDDRDDLWSALPPKVDIEGAKTHVRYGPLADIGLHQTLDRHLAEQAGDKATVHRFGNLGEKNRDRAFQAVKLPDGWITHSNDYIRRGLHQFRCKGPDLLDIAGAPTIINADIAVIIPAQNSDCFKESCEACLAGFIGLGVCRKQHTDTSYALALLCANGEWPYRRSAE